ncbi:MAG: hypothetical protein ACFE85_02710 [Candidatus Hodarchaeota archaeon]
MNRKKKITKLLSLSVILIAITSGSIYYSLAPFLFELNPIGENEFDDTILNPRSSIAGDHPWWDSDWPYRSLVNITNLAGVDLKNYGVVVNLPYGDPEYQGKVNDTLKDIRVIEYINNEPIEREFYIFQDFNGEDYSIGDAAIYFNTNLSASSNTETDVYLYYGNMDVETTAVEYGIGLVKNGDFEYVPSGDDPTGDPSITPHYYNPVGWNWSDDVPDDIAPRPPDVGEDSQTEDQATEWWQNCLIDVPGGVEQVRGTYTYKWGSNQTSITESVGNDDQYAGVFYTNPFTVPIVNDGSGSIYIRFWQNVKTWGFDGSSSKAWNDGYFVRVINASNLFVDPDQHQQIGEYLEYFKGITHNNKGYYSLQNYTTGIITGTFDTSQGDLTGLVTFDLSNYMGQNISLEFGMYGDENTVGNYDTAFVQVDDVEFTYSDDITVELNEIQTQKSDITVIARDIDGMIVPNAEVSLMQDTTLIKKQTTDQTGQTIFTGLNFGIYNFSVNYTFIPSYEDEVFNSTRDNFGTSSWNLYNVSELSHIYDLYLDIWTIDFEIVDWDDDLFDDGYVKVYNDSGGTLLKQISLVNGTARFRWNNASFYYYEVFFYNTRYNVNDFLLNSSYIYRSDYTQYDKYFDHSLSLNIYDQDPGDYYKVNERIYTGGSMSDFSNKKLINFNITLESMDQQIDNMTIYYIDKYNQTSGNIIYQNLSMSGTSYFKSIDIGTVDNDKLKGENYEVYGILVDVQGYNAGAHTGIIKINTTELTNIYNKTALSKMNVRVIDDDDSYNPVPFVSVRIWNGTTIITTLTTNNDGWASHSDTEYEPFIFRIGFSYNITLRRIGVAANFTVNNTSPKQWEPLGEVSEYNYTLNQNSSIILDYEATPPPPTLETQIDIIAEISQAIWGIGDLHITINISYSDDGTNWYLVPDEGFFTCYIEDWDTGQTVLIVDLTANYEGLTLMNYSLTINSSKLSAGNNYKNYWFIIDGLVPGYESPEPYYHQVRVNATATSLDLYDYATHLQISELEKEFSEIINITVRYYVPPDSKLDGATITFDWLTQPLIYFIEDPIDDNYYYCTINTSLAINVGKYPITITALKENYTSKTINTFLEVLERPTTINGSSFIAYSNPWIWVEDEINFTYSYADTLLGGQILGDLDIASYTWQKLYSNGSIIPGIDGSGILSQKADKTYSLDFNTEIRSVGFYFLYINLQKNNYESRFALINLEIRYREIDYTLDATNIKGKQVSAVQGNDIEITINLMDESRGYIPLENATVFLRAQEIDYYFEEQSPGTYTLNFETDEIQAFFISQTFPGTIFAQKANFTTQEIDITITIKMKEVFPGMPTFYFILIVAGSLGIVGSLVGYRVIQQARIPKHIKKIRKVKGYIKSKKPITETISIPSKDETLIKLFGEEWKELGLSLDDVYGVKDMRIKMSKRKDKLIKNGGDTE